MKGDDRCLATGPPDAHAQYEIRVFAQAMYAMIQPLAPFTCEAFEDYRLNTITLTGPEIRAFKQGLMEVGSNRRENDEWAAKMERLGLASV